MKQKGGSARQRKLVVKSTKQNANGGHIASPNRPTHENNNQHEHEHDHDHEPNPFKLFMLFNVFLGAIMYAVYLLVSNPFYMMSNNAEQPLVQVEDNYMEQAVFQLLKSCLSDHPLVAGNDLDGMNFKGTRGFVVKFSEEGVSDFQSNRNFTCLVPYFERARLPNANAFVMNLLICELASGNKMQRRSDANPFAVGTHLDNTIGINSWRTFVAHQVNVLYAVVPNDMRGGDLHVFPFEHDFPQDNEDPVERVTPRENRMVAFKGNAFHRVEQYQTATNTLRVSLVLEQYIVPKSYKSRLTKYEVENRKGGLMM